MAQKHPEPGSDLPVKFQAQFKSLLRLYETKKYKKGLKIANTILKAHPKHGETIAIKGLLVNCMAENNAAQKAEAYALAREGLKLHFRSHICWHVLGLIYRSDRNYEEAIKCYKNALRHDPENGQILRDLSLLQTHSRDLKGLLVTRKKLLVQKPNRTEFWLTFVMVYHLLNQPNKALEVLQSYQSSVEVPKPTDDWEKRFQWNELAMYKNLLLQDAGKYAEAAQQLLDDDGFVLDKTGSLEARAHCWLKAGDERAKKAYHDLLELNAEHYDYIKGYISSLNINEQAADFAQQIEQVFTQLEQEFPRSTAVKRLVLSLLPAGESFKAKLSPYIKPWLIKGVPSLFGSLKDLYTNKEKVNIIADVISSYVTSLRQTGKFPDANDEEPEAPSTLVWALYFLAQHKLALGEFKEAFDAVEEAIAHTPTIIELYVVKAKIYKRANAFKEAAYWMDFARDLDLADRWLNTKSAKYFLLADDVPKADSTIGLFTSKDCDPQTALFDMQCMWFEQEAGESYMRQKRYAPALRKLTSIYQHFQDIDADQFDFHGYCARKMTWNAYVSMLRMEDALYSRAKCYNACKAIVESWIGLYDTPGKETDSQFEEKLAGMDEKEKRIAIKKRKRDQARREQEEAQRNLEKQKEDQKNRKKGRRTEDDPEGEKLTKDKDPLVEATTYVKVLQKHSRQQIGTHLVAFEVNLRKKKVLAALRDVKRAKAIDANHPQVHVNAIRLLNFVKERPLAGVVKDVFDAETAEFGNIDNLLSINDEFLAKNNASLPHRVAAAKVLKLIQPGSDRIEPLLTDLSGTGVTLENCRAALAELSNDKSAAYKAKSHELFPYATVFAPEGEASQ